MNMEHSVNININFGEIRITCPDIVEAARIFTKGSQKESSVSAKDSIHGSLVKTEKAENKVIGDPTTISDAAAVQNDYPTVDPKTFKKYEQFNHMERKLTELVKVSSAEAMELIKKYSSDHSDETETVPPNCWGKVIAEAEDLLSAKKSSKVEPASTEESKEYSLEEVRGLARTVQLNKGKDHLAGIFKSLGRTKLSDFQPSEYTALYMKLKEESVICL